MRYLLIAALLAAACGDDTPAVEIDAGPEITEAALRFADGYQSANGENFTDDFSLKGLREIVSVIDVPVEPGLTYMRVDVLNPNGLLHQRSYRAVSTEASEAYRIEHPVLRQAIRVDAVGRSEAGFVRIHDYIPVMGSELSLFQLTGTFTTQVFLGTDDEASATLENQFVMSN